MCVYLQFNGHSHATIKKINYTRRYTQICYEKIKMESKICLSNPQEGKEREKEMKTRGNNKEKKIITWQL